MSRWSSTMVALAGTGSVKLFFVIPHLVYLVSDSSALLGTILPRIPMFLSSRFHTHLFLLFLCLIFTLISHLFFSIDILCWIHTSSMGSLFPAVHIRWLIVCWRINLDGRKRCYRSTAWVDHKKNNDNINWFQLKSV